ncbi:hypothetical protein [Mesoterricola silvestris]|uniref:Cytochrome c7-like domain-containing protein n=1 Tax=Mesoterricola silvestris TaxID=2927979 RepID=A0AA48GRI8_9BACT|nr:hypothetical protein [Mesoterricola silvestris]BDU74380.1 hypothetical protein METEAL_35540 [Mesoterricola silvestris]
MNKRLIAGTFFAALAALAIVGCSSTAADKAATLNPTTGAHPANWQTTHWAEYLKNPDGCKPCHGSTTDTAAAGGTSGVSCFGCHHPNGPHHPAGWADPAQHGRLGAQGAPNGATYFQGKGFASCTPCHGSDYTSPVGITPSCTSCHTKAPHPSKPWQSGLSPLNPNHDKTDYANASECVKCHALGANSDITPQPPAPAGTTPGCFNGTLCHTTKF